MFNNSSTTLTAKLKLDIFTAANQSIRSKEKPDSCMMSAAQSQTTLVSKLEALQCHFTWDLDLSRSLLLRRKEKFEDIGTEEGNSWLGHIYNLRGFVEYKLESPENAHSLFNKAAEAFSQLRNADEGPWLVVNYGNLAWLHHHLGDQAESEAYLSKVDALMKKYPSPSQDELHPEIYAEKAWTLMKFTSEKRRLAAEYFRRAIRMQPDMVEWNTSYVFAALNACRGLVDADLLEKMRLAKEQDPENLCLAVYYLEQCAKKEENIRDEARELAQKVLRNPVSSYSGIKPLLNVYRNYVSVDEAIDLAEEALKNHPDERYLKRCAALCYQEKIVYYRDGYPQQSVIDRAITLHKEVISLYPHSSLVKEIDLATIYAKSSRGLANAKQIYQELLKRDLEPADKQMLYNQYAKHLLHDCRDYQKATAYNLKAAEIPHKSKFRMNSIATLQKIKDKGRDPMCGEIEMLLANLEQDSKNLCLAVCYLEQCAKKGENIQDEARELAQRVLRNPVSSYCDIKAILSVSRNYVSVDEAIDLAEEALKNHPDERCLKRCAALCYHEKIVNCRDGYPKQSMIHRAISLHKEVISLYPHYSFWTKLDLAHIYQKSRHGLEKAEQVYQELLERNLDPAEKQGLYNEYAKHLFKNCRDYQRSIEYNMKAAKIPYQSKFRTNSIMTLQKIKDRGRDPMCEEIEMLLANLEMPEGVPSTESTSRI